MLNTRGQHLVGTEVGGFYLEKLVGYGGSSAVFLAQPPDSDQKVAVKVFLPRSTMDVPTQKSFYRRFLREAQAASELNHPNILSVYSYGEHQGQPYIAMPYMPGGTLAEYVREHGPLTLREAQSYIEQIAEALDYAHSQGCIHCDVKPANILMGADGRVVLSDFGIVRLLQGAALSSQQSLNSPETLMGTPDFISPEQALGETLDGGSDIYSLAATLFFLLAGTPPFKADSPIAMALCHVHEKPPLLSLSRVDVTPQIDMVIHKALAKFPDDRYPTACEFSDSFTEGVTNAALSHSIDNVELTPLAHEALAQSLETNEDAPRPFVQVRPVARRLFNLPRSLLLIILLGVVLLGSASTAIILSAAANNHQSPIPTQAPSSSSDILIAHQDAWSHSGTYFFQDQRYYIWNKSEQDIAVALYNNHQYGDFKMTVTCQEILASSDTADYFGVVFRASQDQSRYYLFEISLKGQFEFWRYNNGFVPSLESGIVPSINGGLGQDNTITVEARGNTFTFFVNNQQVGKPFTDSSSAGYSTGEVGLSVEDDNAKVAFSGLQVDIIQK